MAVPAPFAGRPLSGQERIWLAADRIHPPFVHQLVIEGRGEIPADRLLSAVAAAAAVHPGMQLRPTGWLRWSRWKTARAEPAFRVVDGSRWDGTGPKGAPFLEEPLDVPMSEVLWATGDPPRLVVRAHQAVTDARGISAFTDDIFRALRQEPLDGLPCAAPTPAELAAIIQAMPAEKLPRSARLGPLDNETLVAPPADRPGPTGAAHIFGTATTWARLRVPGHFPQLLPRIIRALASHARRQSEAPLRVGITVDLRRFAPTLRSSANLTGMLHLDLQSLPSGPEAVEVLESRILATLSKAVEVPLDAEKHRATPLWWLARSERKNAIQNLRRGQFPLSAVLANLGWQDLRRWRDDGFTARRAFWIPAGSPGLPLFLSLSGDDEGVELCASMPAGLADEGRLDSLLADLRADLLVDSLRSLRRKQG